jgi:hypothetical protein
MLVKWGTDQADERGIPCYLESSPEGFDLYNKHGFKQCCQIGCPDNRDPPIGQDSRDLAPDCVGTAGLQPVAELCQASLSLVVLGVGIGHPWC